MIDRGVGVRFACFKCREIFDVDLRAVEVIRGRAFSLIDAQSRCKLSRCRGNGMFVLALQSDQPFVVIASRPEIMTPGWLMRLRPSDIDAPEKPTPDPPSNPLLRSYGTRAA